MYSNVPIGRSPARAGAGAARRARSAHRAACASRHKGATPPNADAGVECVVWGVECGMWNLYRKIHHEPRFKRLDFVIVCILVIPIFLSHESAPLFIFLVFTLKKYRLRQGRIEYT